MDNLFEYIIAAFFIISLLSSLGKKKKKSQMRQQMPGEKSYDRIDNKEDRTTQTQEKIMTRPNGGWGQPAPPSSPKDIFDLIFNEQEQSVKTSQDKPQIQNSQTWDPAAEFGKKIPEPEMHTTIPEIDYDNLPAYDNEKFPGKDKFPKLKKDIRGTRVDLRTTYEYNVLRDDRALKFRQKILNSNSLRDFIIISEILNKPKAFRK